ncbi:MAG: hypothetical protein KJO07_08665 [Deltaproteobacteria bacterium]|nr:hypothetical protein [Deltaproteobacteria bacterium]
MGIVRSVALVVTCAGLLGCGSAEPGEGPDGGVVGGPDAGATDDGGSPEPMSTVRRQVLFDDLGQDDLRLATDSQGRVHGLYSARSFENRGGRPSPSAPTVLRFVVRDQAGEWTGGDFFVADEGRRLSFDFDIAIDSQDRLCAVWVTNGDAGYRRFFGCMTDAGLSAEPITGVNLGTTSMPHLALDADDEPHISIYQHGLVDGRNHRVRHLYRNPEGEWVRENVPVPASYAELAGPDAESSSSCIATADDGTVHIAYDVTTEFYGLFNADLAMISRSPTGEWSEAEIIRTGVAGGEQNERLRECHLNIRADGSLAISYAASFGNSELGYGNKMSLAIHGEQGWEHRDLGTGREPGPLSEDAQGNLYGSYRAGAALRFLRLSSAGQLFEAEMPGSRLQVAVDQGAEGSPRCQLIATSHLVPVYRFWHIEIDGCDSNDLADLDPLPARLPMPMPMLREAPVEFLEYLTDLSVTIQIPVEDELEVSFEVLQATAGGDEFELVFVPPSFWALVWDLGDRQPATHVVRITAATVDQSLSASTLAVFRIGPISSDSDGDLISDPIDNCVDLANGELQRPLGPQGVCTEPPCVGNQGDSDGDGIGDACPEGPSGLPCAGSCGL